MNASERREAIVAAAMPLFARKGFHATTTRDLARAAGVSEALIYRHFPSKESLYRSIGIHHVEDRRLHPGLDVLLAQPASTRRLVLDVQYLVAHLAGGRSDVQPRLIGQSLLGDGGYARAALRHFDEEFGDHLDASLRAARDAGDIEDVDIPEGTRFRFAHHLALALRLMFLPGRGVIDYGEKREAVVERAVRFALRGIGLKSSAIRRHYRPGAWKQIERRGGQA